jgi:O-antigen/teichoic acid export membrane protein
MTDDAHGEVSAAEVSGLFGRDMVYLGAWATQLVLAALMTPVTTRLMVPSEFGRAMVAVTLMQLLCAILGFGLYTGVQRAYASEGGEDDARRVVTLASALGVSAGLVVYVTGRWWSPLVGLGHFPMAVRLAVIWSVLTACTSPALGLIRSRDQLRWFLTASFTQSLFAQGLSLALIAVGHGTATEYLLGQVIGQAAAVVVVVTVTRPKLFYRRHRAKLEEVIRFSVALVPAAIAGFLLDASDRLVIQGDLGPTSLGHYAVARNIGGFAAVILGLLNSIWLPRLFRIKDKAVMRHVLGAGRDGLCALTAGFAVVIATASPLLLTAWSPSSYHPDSLLLITALVAASAIPSGAGLVYMQALIVDGRTRLVAGVTVVSALLNVMLNLLLVPSLGIDGSAGTTLGVAAFTSCVLHRLLGRSAPKVRPGTMVIVIGSGALCIGSAAVPSHGWVLGLRLVVAFIAATLSCIRLLTLAWPTASTRLAARLPGRRRSVVTEG